MDITAEDKFTAKTNLGIFRVSVKPDIGMDFETRERIQKGHIITVGEKLPDCVFLYLPMNSVEGQFTRLDAKTGCSLDPPYSVGGEKTVEMVKLAMTVAKELFPHLQILKLQDSASFPCQLPNGKYYQVNSTDYDLFFYQKSYYDKRYGATLINPTLRKLYDESIDNFSNPDKKPTHFHFLEPILQEQLMPIYAETKTWKEFAEGISERWPDKKKCTVIYIWLKTALSSICDSISFAGQDWQIVLGNQHILKYERIHNGGKYTRKRYKHQKIKIHQSPAPREYLAMDWNIKPK